MPNDFVECCRIRHCAEHRTAVAADCYDFLYGGFFDGLSNIFYRIDPDNAAAGFIAHGVDEFVPRIFFAGFFDRLYQLVDQILPWAETDQIRARCGHLLYSVSCGKPKTNSAIPPCGRNAGAI